MSTTYKYNTFWDLLDNIGIEIPPIQRDYAQGREIPKVNKIRNQFLDSIIQALHEQKELSLDFVYGKIHGIKNEIEHNRNKQAIQSLLNTLGEFALTVDLKLENTIICDKSSSTADFVYLIPLDGQQRLTTLFLFHWYIAKRTEDSNALRILSRFRYKTRKSSSSFLKLITDPNTKINFTPELSIKEELSEGAFFEGVKNNENFSMLWLADPTVHAMMIMLQEIHYKLQDKVVNELERYWESLIDSKLINFSFLDLKDFNLSDELYVKMNGRGKQLTAFENFKAWLFGVIEDEKIIDATTWEYYKQKFDIDWNDLFWKYKEEGVYNIDDAYFNYFKKTILNESVKNVTIEKNSFKEDDRLTTLIDILINRKDFDWEMFKGDIINYIESHFQFLLLFDANLENDYIQTFSKYYFGAPDKDDWQSAIKNYITYSFIKTKEKCLSAYDDCDVLQLNEYHRIMHNLFNNTIIDNQSLYHLAYNEIDQLNTDLKGKNHNFSEWVEEFEYTSKSVFTEQQILEEILKCRLMHNLQWKDLILEAEKSLYFEGQLNFWFFQIGISIKKEEYNVDLLTDSHLKNKFRNVTEKIQLMFTNDGIDRKGVFSNSIFERSLLSKADYLLSEKGYKCFGRNTGRDVSWKRLFFRDRNNQATNDGLKEIFELDFTNLKSSFEHYISKNLALFQIDNWRKLFIENAELFNYLGNLKYIREIDNHGWVIIKGSYKTYIGEHYELFSLDFYLKKLKDKSIQPFHKIDYYPAPKNSLDDFPCANLNCNYQKVDYAIDVKFLHNTFQIIFFAPNSNTIDGELETNLNYIGLTRDKHYLYITFDNSDECFNKIIEIGQKLLIP